MSYSVYPTPAFSDQVKNLKKKYRSIGDDLLEYAGEFKKDKLPGDPITGFANRVFKDRVKNWDNQKGKSAGYRLVYYVDHVEKDVYLLCLYSKNEKENLRKDEINHLLRQLGL